MSQSDAARLSHSRTMNLSPVTDPNADPHLLRVQIPPGMRILSQSARTYGTVRRPVEYEMRVVPGRPLGEKERLHMAAEPRPSITYDINHRNQCLTEIIKERGLEMSPEQLKRLMECQVLSADDDLKSAKEEEDKCVDGRRLMLDEVEGCISQKQRFSVERSRHFSNCRVFPALQVQGVTPAYSSYVSSINTHTQDSSSPSQQDTQSQKRKKVWRPLKTMSMDTGQPTFKQPSAEVSRLLFSRLLTSPDDIPRYEEPYETPVAQRLLEKEKDKELILYHPAFYTSDRDHRAKGNYQKDRLWAFQFKRRIKKNCALSMRRRKGPVTIIALGEADAMGNTGDREEKRPSKAPVTSLFSDFFKQCTRDIHTVKEYNMP